MTTNDYELQRGVSRVTTMLCMLVNVRGVALPSVVYRPRCCRSVHGSTDEIDEGEFGLVAGGHCRTGPRCDPRTARSQGRPGGPDSQ